MEPPDRIAEAYRTGRGAFRLRAHWEVEDMGRGTWQIIVTEIPYQVQKSKLIEKLAELIQTKKVPILADVRDESADDVRIVLEPRSKNVDPQMLMGTLFRQSDLETRFSLNMNVLIDGRTPKVCSLKEVLRAFLDHRRERADPPVTAPDGQDRPPAGGSGRLHHRLPEPRPRDRHHPLRRDAQNPR